MTIFEFESWLKNREELFRGLTAKGHKEKNILCEVTAAYEPLTNSFEYEIMTERLREVVCNA